MKCEDIKNKITSYLLGDLDEATAAVVEKHLEECEGCRAELDGVEPTLDLLRAALAEPSTAQEKLSDERKSEVILQTQKPAKEKTVKFDWWITRSHPRLAMAASVAIVVGFLWAVSRPMLRKAVDKQRVVGYLPMGSADEMRSVDVKVVVPEAAEEILEPATPEKQDPYTDMDGATEDMGVNYSGGIKAIRPDDDTSAQLNSITPPGNTYGTYFYNPDAPKRSQVVTGTTYESGRPVPAPKLETVNGAYVQLEGVDGASDKSFIPGGVKHSKPTDGVVEWKADADEVVTWELAAPESVTPPAPPAPPRTASEPVPDAKPENKKLSDSDEMVPLKYKVPKPLFQGTPKVIKSDNLESVNERGGRDGYIKVEQAKEIPPVAELASELPEAVEMEYIAMDAVEPVREKMKAKVVDTWNPKKFAYDETEAAQDVKDTLVAMDNVKQDAEPAAPPTDFAPMPAELDLTTTVKSPVIMKNIYGSRAPGARGVALKAYGASAAQTAAEDGEGDDDYAGDLGGNKLNREAQIQEEAERESLRRADVAEKKAEEARKRALSERDRRSKEIGVSSGTYGDDVEWNATPNDVNNMLNSLVETAPEPVAPGCGEDMIIGRQGMSVGETAAGSGTIVEGQKSARVSGVQDLEKRVVDEAEAQEEMPVAGLSMGALTPEAEALIGDLMDKQEELGEAKDRDGSELSTGKGYEMRMEGGTRRMESAKTGTVDQKGASTIKYGEVVAEHYKKLSESVEKSVSEVPTDLHILTDLQTAREVVEDVFEVFEEGQGAGEGRSLAKREEYLEGMEEVGARFDDTDKNGWGSFAEFSKRGDRNNEILHRQREKIEVKEVYKGKKKADKEKEADELTGPVFKAWGVNNYVATAVNNLSTFAIDVDTAAYTVMRSYASRGILPPPEAVRTEEYVNFFDYAYNQPRQNTFEIHADCAPSKFGRGKHLLKLGIKGRKLGREEQRQAVVTLLVDTSGSMEQPDRMGLVVKSLQMLLDRLDPKDKVAIVQYSSEARLVMEHTPASKKKAILKKIKQLSCGGSTNLEKGMGLAYQVASNGFIGGGENRVIILSDGAANLGSTEAESILKKVEGSRKQGVFCSVLGFGMGTYNDAMLEELANKGDGTYSFIDSKEEAERVLVQEFSATLNNIARDVKIQVEFNKKRVKQYRQMGYENRQLKAKDFRNDSVDAGEVGSGQSVTALYELDLNPDSSGHIGIVRVRYRRADTGKVEEVSRGIKASDLVRNFDDTDARFKLAACAAEYAEILRGSPFAKGSKFEDVAKVLRPVALELTLDKRVQEFLRIISSAHSFSR